MARQSSENLTLMPTLIGQMEDSTTLQSIKCFDFPHERRPLRVGKPGYFVSGEPHYSGCVVDSGGATQTPSLLSLERVFLRRFLCCAHTRCHPGHRQPHSQKVHQ